MSEMQMILNELNRLRERVAHLETRQEHPGFAASDVARLSVANTFAGDQTIPNTGLHLLDTNATHDLIIAPGSNLTADRTLTITTGDANRTITLSGDLTVPSPGGTVALLATANAFTAAQSITVANSIGFNSSNSSTSSSTSGGGLIASAAAIPSAADHRLGLYLFAGYTTGTTYNYAARISAFSSQAWSATAAGSYFVFQTTPDNNTSVVERMRITSNGPITINTPTANGQLTVNQSSTTAAIPTLSLNQADISEGFIDFTGTSAASAAGPISSWTVATIAGFVRCEINGAAYWMPYYNAPTA